MEYNTSIWIASFISAMRDKRGNVIQDAYLKGTWSRVVKLLFLGIKPVFVFDGKPPMLKSRTLSRRRRNRAKAEVRAQKMAREMLLDQLKQTSLKKVKQLVLEGKLDLKEALVEALKIQNMGKDNRQESEEMKINEIPWAENTLEEPLTGPTLDVNWLRTLSPDDKSVHEKSYEAQLEILLMMRVAHKGSVANAICETNMDIEQKDYSSLQLEQLVNKGCITRKLEQVKQRLDNESYYPLASDPTVKYRLSKTNTEPVNSLVDPDSNFEIRVIKSLDSNIETLDESGDIIAEDEELREECTDSPISDSPLHSPVLSGLTETSTEDNHQAIEIDFELNDPSNSDSNARQLDSAPSISDLICEDDRNFVYEEEISLEEDDKEYSSVQFETTDDICFPAAAKIGNDSIERFCADQLEKMSVDEVLGQDLYKGRNQLKNNDSKAVHADFILPKSDLKNGHEVDANRERIQLEKAQSENSFNQEETVKSQLKSVVKNELGITEHAVICGSNDGMGRDEKSDVLELEKKKKIKTDDMDRNVNERNNENRMVDLGEFQPSDNDKITEFDTRDALNVPKIRLERSYSESQPESHCNVVQAENESIFHSPTSSFSEFQSPQASGLDSGYDEQSPSTYWSYFNSIESELSSQRQARKNNHRSSFGQNVDISEEMITQIKYLLRLFGIPYVQSPGEADAQCAALRILGLVDGIISDDSDILVFGGFPIFRHAFLRGHSLDCYSLESIEDKLQLSQTDLIFLALLLGGDYADGIKGIGPVIALDIVTHFRGSDGPSRFITWIKCIQEKKSLPDVHDLGFEPPDKSFAQKHLRLFKTLQLPNNFVNLAVIDAYLNPQVDRSLEKFTWCSPDYKALTQYAKMQFGWSESKISSTLDPILKNHTLNNSQTKMDDFVAASPSLSRFTCDSHTSESSSLTYCETELKDEHIEDAFLKSKRKRRSRQMSNLHDIMQIESEEDLREIERVLGDSKVLRRRTL
ncbi:uncharacterized protein LOC126320490 isoform X2 [Schistocerca gregaria]|uniref:uncharacterized protein LOC126320490 isoform X2 n=1 Tax=Schistocerca gregaria TaxID=7010 RepID=UPI00211EE36D|nr:uncharacterized protein LOC126320490 isoform X2 [Schistocerca gregaria]